MKQARELRANEIRKSCDPALLGFTSTDELHEPLALGGQQRAEEAISLALYMVDRRYNLYVAGRSGSGRLSTVLKMVDAAARSHPADRDWCYLHNFEHPDEPLAIALPAGGGEAFAAAIDGFVVGCRRELTRAFASDGYQQQRNSLEREMVLQRTQLLEELEQTALQHGFLLQETQLGINMIPLKMPSASGPAVPTDTLPENRRDGAEIPSATGKLQPLSPQEFAELPISEQQHIREQQQHVEEAFAAAMPKVRALEAEARARLEGIEHETAESVTRHLLDEITQLYAGDARIHEFIGYLAADILAHANVVRSSGDELASGNDESPDDGSSMTTDLADGAVAKSRGSSSRQPGARNASGIILDQAFRDRPAVAALLRRYQVNVLVAHKTGVAAPVIQEMNPTYLNLLGRIEFGLQGGLPYTDHLMIKAGAFHKANGGYLILQAAALLGHPHAWEAVKRVVRFGVIAMENSEEPQLTPVSASLRPEPIPALIKVILIGDPDIYAALLALDPEFGELFKVRADFDEEVERNHETEGYYSRFIADTAHKAGVPPLTVQAVAALIEEGSRMVEDQDELSTRLRTIADLTLEAGYMAGQASASLTGREHVEQAIAAADRRNGLLSDKLDKLIRQHTILIDTSGEVVGQVNGLTVLTSAGESFGKPARITARTSPGMAGIVNLERETQMSGPAHSKGILILTGYLAGRYATDYPLSLLGSICFEQIYGGIEGDSASSAELYALLSSLSGLPLKQGLAVTGSVNQRGEVQAVGGVNQKIEGFFSVCVAAGLTGDQGVLIPEANTRNLMLREPVVRAVQSGTFHIYAVRSIDAGMELLTGVPAGDRGAGGTYPEKTMNWYVDQTLRTYFQRVHAAQAAGAAILR